jgi:predicted permease
MMSWLRVLFTRLLTMFHKEQQARELNEEIESHLEMLAEEKRKQGMSAAEARNAALREFGGVSQTREKYREMSGLRFVETLGQDLRYSLRMLRRNPGFATVMVLLLALGVGANTAIFSAINAVMLRLLPVHDPQRLVMLTWQAKGHPEIVQDLEGSGGADESTGLFKSYSFPYPVFEYLSEHNHALSDVFAFAANDDEVNVGFNGRAAGAVLDGVSGGYFEGLGIPALLGRNLVPGDDQEASPPVAMVSYEFWRVQLGQDQAITGKSIVVNGVSLAIVGVSAPASSGLNPGHVPGLWIPLHLYARLQSDQGNLNDGVPLLKSSTTWWAGIAGRLKPGVTQEHANSELSLLFDQYIQDAAAAQKSSNVPKLALAPMKQGLDNLRKRFSTSLMLLMGMVGLVLIIACGNAAGLLLARATARQKEIAIRLSLGAGRFRLIRQLLTDSMLLALLGGALGLVFAKWASLAVLALLSGGRAPVDITLPIDSFVLVFALVISALSGILFGLAPALRATKVEPLAALRQSVAKALGRSFTSGKALAAGQVALCLLLLISAALFLRTLQRLVHLDVGFDRQNLLIFSVRPGLNGYKGDQLANYYSELQRRIQAIPGVHSVGFSMRAPIGGGYGITAGEIPGYTKPGESVQIYRHDIGPGYFDTLGVPMIVGRPIEVQDEQSAPHVVVINQGFVHDYFHGDNPIGRRINLGDSKRPREFEIVGVAKDVKYNSLRAAVPPTAYFSYLQRPTILNFMAFEVRAQGDLPALISAVRREAQALDKDVPVVNLRTQSEIIDEQLSLERAFATLSTAFGMLALLLACIGLYGTMSYAVARRTNEIGIRMALGAPRGAVLSMVLRESWIIVISGLAVGLPLAWATTRFIKSMLFGLTPHDPGAILAATIAVIAVTIIAGYLPARRASRVDPMVALRYE